MTTRRQINLSVDPKVHDRVAKLAAAAGMSTSGYATMLFEAAYSARCKETGDVDLATADSRVALLFGTGFDIPAIRQATGLGDTFVGRTISAWQAEMRRGPAPAKVKVARKVREAAYA